MSEEAPKFGAVDLAGSKFASPSQANDAEALLIDESIRRKRFSRWFATGTLVFLSLAAACCLVFSMWVGSHFLEGLDQKKDHKEVRSAAQLVATPTTTPEPNVSKAATPPKKDESLNSSTDTVKETIYIEILAPLIPASLASFIAIILFITIARLVTNFEKMGRENPEKDQTEDYGTIAAFFQEIAKLIKSFKKE